MRISIATDAGQSTEAEVALNTTVAEVKTLVAAELGIPIERQSLVHNGKLLADASTLGGAGVGEHDLLLVTPPQAARPSGPTLEDMPRPMEPDSLLKFFDANPQLLRQLNHVNEDLAKAIRSRDPRQIRTSLMMLQMGIHKMQWEEQEEQRILEADPFNEENQRKIADRIQQKGIEENYKIAMEEAPEVFGRVTMLYIDAEVNTQHLKVFVDSGAQSTIMTVDCAQRCNLMHLLDKRFAGEARGVGTCKILGRIHMAHMKIGGTFFPCSFTVLERGDVEFLFGLDMLKRHQCVIDLKRGVLQLGNGSETSFLSEKDLPSHARETQAMDIEGREGGASKPAPMDPSASAASAGNPPLPPPPDTRSSEAAASAAGAAVASAGAQVAAQQELETKVEQLMGMGFPRRDAVMALQSAGSDVDQAAALLLAQL